MQFLGTLYENNKGNGDVEMRSIWTFALIFSLCAASSACRPDPASGGDGDADGDSDVDGDGDSDGDGDGDVEIDADYLWPDEGCTKVDLLFVIDDSGSMSEEQSNLAANFPLFIQAIENYRTPADPQLDYRVGVTSTSRAGFTYDGTVTSKTGGALCEPGQVCGNASYTCECLATNCTECTDECPGNCFCEPVGLTAPIHEVCNGEDGRLVLPPGYTEPWIQGPGDYVANAFSATAQLGTGGCGNEMPLYAVEHALSTEYYAGPGQPNEHFLRDGALLMVIILTDEDDCSTEVDRIEDSVCLDLFHPFASLNDDAGCTDALGDDLSSDYLPMTHYIGFLDDLMGGRNHWAAAAIAGETSCDTDYGSAYTAHRLKQFIELTGDNGVFHDICSHDLASALDAALDTLTVACDEYILY